MNTLWWIAVIYSYYAAVLAFLPRVSCQWPFNQGRLWFFGLIPLAGALVGLCVCRNRAQRAVAWILLALAVAGACISFQPWCNAIGLRCPTTGGHSGVGI